jgi:hypothetical protein
MTILGRGFIPAWENLALIGFGALVIALYVLHARRVEAPIIDLSLLSITTFRVSITGGSLFRIGIGALPLLLPLMLQISFGMSPLGSGLTTFVAAAGAMAMKATAAPILNTFGFKRVLVVNAFVGGIFIAANAFFTPATPTFVILAILLVGGYFRSLEFTGINAIAYADLEQDRLSRAVSFASVAQQLSLSIGVALGAGVVQLLRARHGGGALELADFQWAFVVVAVVTTLSAWSFIRLPANAGASLRESGSARASSAVGEAKPGPA